MTNQPVRDKTGAEEEDELSIRLSEQYKTRVIVLDRLWLADTVKSRKLWELVFDCLHIDRPPATKQLSIGPLDLERKRELDKLDESISDSFRYQFSKHQLIEDCLQAARLARGLGHDRKEIDGRFSQCTRLARKHGTHEQLIRVLFNQCWTEAFWFDDLSNVDRIYDEIEPLALDSNSVWMCVSVPQMPWLKSDFDNAFLIDANRLLLAGLRNRRVLNVQESKHPHQAGQNQVS